MTKEQQTPEQNTLSRMYELAATELGLDWKNWDEYTFVDQAAIIEKAGDYMIGYNEATSAVSQLIEAAREAKDTLSLIVDRLAAVSTQARCEMMIEKLETALKPFEK